MEKDIAKIKKNDNTDIVIRIDDFGGKKGVTIREYTTSDRYTGFTKSGTRIPVSEFLSFREAINSVSLEDLKEEKSESSDKKNSSEEQEEIEDY
jgi:hypothetical protein